MKKFLKSSLLATLVLLSLSSFIHAATSGQIVQFGNAMTINTKSGAYTIGTDDPAECYGGVVTLTTTATLTMCTAAPTMYFTVYTYGSVTLTLDPAGSEAIIRDGTLQTGGVTIVSPGTTTGSVALCWYYAASTWQCITNSPDGTKWAEGS